MRAGEHPFVGLNVKEQNQIVNVSTNNVVLSRLSPNKGFRIGVVNGGEGVEEECCLVGGDLEGIGDCS